MTIQISSVLKDNTDDEFTIAGAPSADHVRTRILNRRRHDRHRHEYCHTKHERDLCPSRCRPYKVAWHTQSRRAGNRARRLEGRRSACRTSPCTWPCRSRECQEDKLDPRTKRKCDDDDDDDDDVIMSWLKKTEYEE
jgi:hypothetical protein